MRRGIQVLMQDAQSGKFDLVLKETAFPASRKTSQGLQAPALCRRKDYTLSEGEIRNKESCHEVRAPKVPLPRGPHRDKRVRRTVKFTMLRAAAQHGAKPLISLHRRPPTVQGTSVSCPVRPR
jgi:hypothetical protein